MKAVFATLQVLYALAIIYVMNAVYYGEVGMPSTMAAMFVIIAIFASTITLNAKVLEDKERLKEENFELKRELIHARNQKDENTL